MAYNIVGSPDIFSPSNNPMYFYLDSTNINEEGFKYIVDVYNADSLQRIGSYRLFPRIGDGYGVADINQLLKQEVTYDMNQTNNNILPALNSFVNYEIDFGEEYVQYWDWFDTEFVPSGPFSTLDYTLVTSTGTTNPFVSGDTVFLQQNATNESEVYNNVVVTVLSANSSSFIVGIPFVPTTTVGGTARFANSQKTQFSGATVTGYTAFNAAIPHQQFINYTSELYDLTGTTNQFLTNAPQGYTVQPTNQMWLNFYSTDPENNTTSITLTTEYGTYNLVNNNPDKTVVQQVGIGPANITAVEGIPDLSGDTQWNLGSGTYPIFKNVCYQITFVNTNSANLILFGADGTNSPWEGDFIDEYVIFHGDNGQVAQGFIQDADVNKLIIGFPSSGITATSGKVYQRTTWYSIQMASGLTETSEVKLFNVDSSPSRYDNIELVFLDRLGSFIPANFSLQSAKSINITRNEYTKILGDLGNNGANKWGYQSTERGRQNFGTFVKTQVTAISNWITEAESNYLQELYSSQNVYVREYGQLWPVIITSNSYSIVTKNNKKNIQITITFEYANNDTVN
jgi:hypothetical protein